MKKQRPFYEESEMITAILNNRKTQIRRLVNAQPDDVDSPFLGLDGIWRFSKNTARHPISDSKNDRVCPYGKEGDILWIKEPFYKTHISQTIFYKSDNIRIINIKMNDIDWIPSVKMKECDSRVWLEIVNISIKRLQDLSEIEAINNGIANQDVYFYKNYLNHPSATTDPILSFETYWRSKKTNPSWESNPWVWVIDFKRIEKPTNHG